MSMHPKCEYTTLLLMNIVGRTIEGLLNLFPHYKHRGLIRWVLVNHPSTSQVHVVHYNIHMGLKFVCHVFLSIQQVAFSHGSEHLVNMALTTKSTFKKQPPIASSSNSAHRLQMNISLCRAYKAIL